MMYFAWMKHIIKRIFRLLYSYIAIFVIFSCILVYIKSGITDDKHTTINIKKIGDKNKWIYNLGKKTIATVLPTKRFKDLIVNATDKYSVQTVTLVTIVIVIGIAYVLGMCYLCGKTFFSRQSIEPNAIIPDVVPDVVPNVVPDVVQVY